MVKNKKTFCIYGFIQKNKSLQPCKQPCEAVLGQSYELMLPCHQIHNDKA